MITSQIVLQIEEEEEVESAAELLDTAGGSVIETRRHGRPVDLQTPQPEFEPVTAILIGGGALAVARFIIGWRERLKGGVVIDLRPGVEAEIRRSKDVPYGWILIYPRDNGALRIEVRDEPKDWVERILEKIIDGTLGTVHEIAEAAKEAGKEDRVTSPNGTPVT